MMDIYLISGSHWDREWYQTFQGFRFRLVKMIDKLIDVLENEDSYGIFHFDGQTIVLEDYLEIMPENADRIKKLIQSGKIKIGPWYCMPDEFLVSGESLIKNLKKGMEISRSYETESLNCGYICDIFGHIAQMPQIFKKLGIDNAVMWRGLGEADVPMFFDWTSPDGTAVRTVRLNPDNGYASFTVDVLGRDESKIPSLSDESLKENLKKHIDMETERANLPYLYLSDAFDHISCHEKTAHYIDLIKKLYPDATVYHVSMEELFDKIKDEEVISYDGELYNYKKGDLGPTIINTLSSRYWLKKTNDLLQNFIELWISPLYAFKKITIPKSYLELAYTYLLKNHPHDSICGCSIDRVHENMKYRFNQCEEITGEIFDAFRLSVTDEKGGFDKVVKIFNPLPYSDCRCVTVDVCFEADYPASYKEGMGYEKINSFKIFDENDNEIEYSIVDINTDRTIRVVDQIFKTPDVYTISFKADLRAMGDTCYKIIPHKDGVIRYFGQESMLTKTAENEHIKLTLNHDGSINMYDKKTNTEYKNLISPISCGEIGDGWIHVSPAADSYSASTNAFVEVFESSAVKTTFKITQILKVPEDTINDKRGYHRSEKYADVTLVHFVTLGKGERYVSVKTIVDNTAKNHRLSLIFPTGITNNKYSVNQAFCFVERDVVNRHIYGEYNEYPTKYKQHGGIMLKRENGKGFAFVSKCGLHEGGADENGNLICTLFRSFSNFYMTNGETDSLALGKSEFEYIIMPLDDSVTNTDIQKRQDFLRAETRYAEYNGDAEKGKTDGFEILCGDIAYSTAYSADNGFAGIRLYNPESKEVTAKIQFSNGVAEVYETDFNDNIIKSIDINNCTVNLYFSPYEIKTINIR